jgi:pimeloyl-ACP methyl ester carboxylesterase
VPELTASGHEAIAVRLPADDDAAGWPEYVDAVIDAVAGQDEVVVVAASMGGFTAPIVCVRREVELFVMVNAMIPVPGETFTAWWSNTGWETAQREYLASIGLSGDADDHAVIYYHDLSAELRDEAMTRDWQDQSAARIDESWPLQVWPDIPTRVLAGRHDRMFPLEFQRRVARQRLGLEVDAIDGGHMLALSNPRGLADRLVAYHEQQAR